MQTVGLRLPTDFRTKIATTDLESPRTPSRLLKLVPEDMSTIHLFFLTLPCHFFLSPLGRVQADFAHGLSHRLGEILQPRIGLTGLAEISHPLAHQSLTVRGETLDAVVTLLEEGVTRMNAPGDHPATRRKP